MKKFTALFCTLALLTALAVPARAIRPETVPVRFHDETAMAYGPETLSEVVNVFLDGAPMVSDMPAVSWSRDGTDSRTMVPVRPIAEALGADVEWLPQSRQVRLSQAEDVILLTLGLAEAEVNGRRTALPGNVPAVVAEYEGAERTLVPLRFVSEGLHATVEWDNEAYAARVTGKPLPAAITPAPARGQLSQISADDNAQTITLSLSTQPDYRVTDLGDRVAIDLLGVTIGSGRDGSLRPENPVVGRVRYAQHGTDIDPGEEKVTRVVLDLVKGCTYKENVTITADARQRTVVIAVTPPETLWELPGDTPLDPAAFTVVLDAGHGGSAPGAIYEEVEEKDLTLPVTLRAAQLLREKGYNVVLTRSDDRYVDLYDRCDIANNVSADVFVSIHANASSTNLSFQGTFTYSYPDSTEGAKLAGAIQDAVVAWAGSIDRGLLTNNYVVLRETFMPAALLEMGFMSCHEELGLLIQPEYREKIAQGVAQGVENYLSTLPPKEKQAEEEPPSPGEPGGKLVSAEEEQ